MISKSEFDKFEKVRLSGDTNIFDVNKVCELSRLDKADVLEIMRAYNLLRKKFYGGNP
jgi:hypothetical protein